ncbi:MAG: nidogen-like domain-containing protein [Bacteroidota bacterium]
MNRFLPFLIVGCVLSQASLYGQCNSLEVDTLVWEQFEQGLPSFWKAPNGTDGASWHIDNGKIGYYLNAGEGSWLYIDDERGDQAGTAFFETAEYDFSEYSGFLQMEFDLTFQDFADSGYMQVEVFDQGEWKMVMKEADDFFGHISIDIQDFAKEKTRFRFTYNDEGAWGWGMGIDHFLITGKEDLCGNEVCDYGESPESCPGDCPQPTADQSSWIEVQKDLDDQDVSYKRFNGNNSCDDCTEKVELGFEFQFYEQSHTSAFINANGNLTFEDTYLAFTPTPFCLAGPKMIAPFFADVDLQGGGEIWYYADPDGHYFIATWEEVSYFGCGKDCDQTNTFQLILTDGTVRNIGNHIIPRNTTVIFQYKDMQWTTGNSSEGSNGFWGKAATVGLNKGDEETCHDYGTFDQPGYGYYEKVAGMECLNNGVDHLDYRTITYDGLSGIYVEPNGKLYLSLKEEEDKNVIRIEKDEVGETEFFVVERSEDGHSFEELGNIQTDEALEGVTGFYEFIDLQPLTGTNHYRILEVKTDGDLEYSDVQHLDRVPEPNEPSNSGFALTQVGPNPFKNHLNVSFHSPKQAQVKYILVDMNGRIQHQGSLNAQEGTNAMRLELANLPTAMYVLTVYQGEEKDHRSLVKK